LLGLICAPEYWQPGEAACGPHAPSVIGAVLALAPALLPQLLDRFPCLPGGEITGQPRARTCSRTDPSRLVHARAAAAEHAPPTRTRALVLMRGRRADPTPAQAAGAQKHARGDLLFLHVDDLALLHEGAAAVLGRRKLERSGRCPADLSARVSARGAGRGQETAGRQHVHSPLPDAGGSKVLACSAQVSSTARGVVPFNDSLPPTSS
jgi:hypothetical protein